MRTHLDSRRCAKQGAHHLWRGKRRRSCPARDRSCERSPECEAGFRCHTADAKMLLQHGQADCLIARFVILALLLRVGDEQRVLILDASQVALASDRVYDITRSCLWRGGQRHERFVDKVHANKRALQTQLRHRVANFALTSVDISPRLQAKSCIRQY